MMPMPRPPIPREDEEDDLNGTGLHVTSEEGRALVQAVQRLWNRVLALETTLTSWREVQDERLDAIAEAVHARKRRVKPDGLDFEDISESIDLRANAKFGQAVKTASFRVLQAILIAAGLGIFGLLVAALVSQSRPAKVLERSPEAR